MSPNVIDHDILDIDRLLELDSGFVETTSNDYVYVDIQGFKMPGNAFMCKEFCLLDDNNYTFHAFIKSTTPFIQLPTFYKRQANWLMDNYHKIDYNFGDINLFDLCDQMFPKIQNKIVLVKGLEKTKWLKKMFRDYGEIECLDIDSLHFDTSLKQADPYNVCDYHNQVFNWTKGPCAMSTALMIQDLAHKNMHI